MCELLIRNVDNVNPDPDKDLSGSYKKGDVVEVRPDGCEYGKNELSDRFRIVKYPGVPVEDMQHLTQMEMKSNSEVLPLALIGIRRLASTMSRHNREIYSRRSYYLDVFDNVIRKAHGARHAINTRCLT